MSRSSLQEEINAIQGGWHVMDFGPGLYALFPYSSNGTLGKIAATGTRQELIYFVKQKLRG